MNTRTRENTNLLSRRLGRRNHVISVLCVVVTGSVGWSRRGDNWRVNGCCNSPIHRNNRDLVQHGEQRTKKIFEGGTAMTGQKENVKLTTGEHLTKRELNRPKQAYLYKSCVKQNTQKTTSTWGFLSLNPGEIWGVCTRWPQWEENLNCDLSRSNSTLFICKSFLRSILTLHSELVYIYFTWRMV